MDRKIPVISLEDIPPADLGGGSWSKILITRERVPDNLATLGYSCFKPGTVTASIVHETEEFVYVVHGSGELRLDGEAVPFRANQALFIPPGVWHGIANTGEEDVVMVFGFPSPEYPPTRRR
ncbi:cupin domain-containing protein [Paenibacillus humicola]|uniref:cupin domain-containing protein n=1 Tax=Paenibacillus humicola TaxID=3110540 RepID=UPI00237B08B8|nr:cupin domain-containing protein [Paenibacillus humicola]